MMRTRRIEGQSADRFRPSSRVNSMEGGGRREEDALALDRVLRCFPLSVSCVRDKEAVTAFIQRLQENCAARKKINIHITKLI